MDPWSHSQFHTDSFADRMREAAVDRHGRKVRGARKALTHSLSLTHSQVREEDSSRSLIEDIEVKELERLGPLRIRVGGEIEREKHFRGKRSPSKLVGAEFFYEEDDEVVEDFSGPGWAWDE